MVSLIMSIIPHHHSHNPPQHLIPTKTPTPTQPPTHTQQTYQHRHHNTSFPYDNKSTTYTKPSSKTINNSLTKSRYLFITIYLQELQQNNPLTVTDYQSI